jgi:hypothetical protein
VTRFFSKTLALAAGIAAWGLMTTAHATIIFLEGNHPSSTEENILFQQKFNDVTTLTGHTNQTNAPVEFDIINGAKNGELDIGTNGVGQADIICTIGCNTFSQGGANGAQLTDLEIKLGAGFGATDFVGNLDFGEGTAQITVTDQMGAVFPFVLSNGQNFFTLQAINGEVITDIQITELTADPKTGTFGWNDLKQPRISGICTLQGTTCTAILVPEPSSLTVLGGALLLGFGLIRRRKA